jgi:hypothetical protein
MRIPRAGRLERKEWYWASLSPYKIYIVNVPSPSSSLLKVGQEGGGSEIPPGPVKINTSKSESGDFV